MPSLSTVPRRRQRSEENEDDDETSTNSSRDPTPVSRNSINGKRRRLSPVQDGADEEEDDGEISSEGSDEGTEQDTPELTQADPRTAQPSNSQPRSLANDEVDEDGYKPGAIVRIKVTDFVTYTSAEFFPGPKLNMVIGPNGTGKSTLVCAICLGLGWGPQHLGRAKDPGEFVKHGCREASIEIELAKGPGLRKNPVIGRTIKREGNKSSFTINGKQASLAQVKKFAQSFAIQIDNLCQFLPQDKVSEFAALTPVELLNSTQRAAAGPEMIEWHESLKKLRAEQKKLQLDNQSDKDLLANLENRQEMQRVDVERMRQRAQIKRKIEMLEQLRPVIQYREARNELKQKKIKERKLRKELEDLEAELEPALRAVNAKQRYCSQLDEVVKYKKRCFEQADRDAIEIVKKIEQFDDALKDLNNQIEAEKKSGQSYRQEATKIQQTINRLNRELNDEPAELDIGWYNERIKEKRLATRELEGKATEIQQARLPLVEELKSKNDQIRRAEQQLHSLASQSGQQEAKLRGASQHSYQAYKWLQDNQDKFEKEVFGPPVVTCSVKDPKYANAIESLLQRTDFTAFTTQTRNDFRTLQRALVTEMRLHDISIRTSTTPLESFRPPVSDEELRSLGFDGWAKDFLSGPEPVLAVLCSENRLHQTPINLQGISDETFARLENGSISSWVAGKQNYQIVRRREYGPGAVSTRVRQVRPAQIWTSQAVDVVAKQEIERKILALKDEVSQVKEKMESERSRLHRMGEEKKELDRERAALEKEKAEKQTALINYKAIPERIRQQEAKKKDIERLFGEMRIRVLDIRGRQDQISIQKAKANLEYADAVENLRRLQEEVTQLSIRLIEGLSDCTTLRERSQHHKTRLDEKNSEVKAAHEDVKAQAEAVGKMVDQANRAVRVVNEQEDLREFMPTLVEHTLEQLEADIDSERAHLELVQGGNANVIKEFEEREKQIEKLRDKVTEFQNQLSEYDHAINEIRGKWEPKLEELVKSISDAFSDSFARIGCAGQVTLDKAEDEEGPNGEPGGSNFDQWSIQIQVKFRENENLSILDSHRQSGGERAVSTIFYLMALQSLSASPFRVVDEINQGMDPRNERMVHGRLVDIACAPARNGGGGGQYFLITPKLLSGLVYKPGMRVLCIYSGEHMPEDYNLLDFGGAIKRMRALNAKRKGKGRAIEDGAHRSNVDVYG
ncbi:structural maintenance of chromosomes protein 5 [Aspergillus udagawae]|uniref:Structural maintenance of chromosomes protein 5 n=1 Tax=Aspergillus udagawae TaxID=91492 RepID=A0A8E0QTJ7_9EURO|nr:structural maintenance of chromosomes protein 5 [Aspergillus udagawae]GFF24475.1 structural maintenance of chromosomes protein 5 [Aspergillus udagawae]GIC88776.1 structural maintenance of chromosomes protein 5 [Aspergillus udagawae]